MKIKTLLFLCLTAFVFLMSYSSANAQACVSACTSNGSCVGLQSNSCGNARNCRAITQGGGMCQDWCTCDITTQGQNFSSCSGIDATLSCSFSGGTCQVSGGTGTFPNGPAYVCGGGGGGGGSCNNNSICDAGETNASCPNDCTVVDPGVSFVTLSASPVTQSILNGETKTYTLALTPSNSLTTGYGDERAIGDYTLTTPIAGCPTGATCTYSGGNTMIINRDTTVGGVDYAVAASKTVIVTAYTASPATYSLTFSAVDGINRANNATENLIVNAGVNNASCTSITAPASVSTGQNFNVTVTMQNNGSTTWTPSGSNNYHLLVSPWSATPWSNARTPVASNVAPGASYTFTLPVTAPATAGTYALGTQMLQEGVQWFGALCNNAGNITVTPPAPTVTLSANPTTGASPLSTTLTWSTGNTPTSCTAGGGWGGSKAPTGGSQVISGIVTGTTYTLFCTNAAGNSATVSVNVTPIGAISVSISANPASMTLPTNSTNLTWTTTGSPASCTASNYWTGAKSASGGSEVRSGMTAQTYVYVITCSKAGVPDTTASVSVPVSSAALVNNAACEDITAPDSVVAGQTFAATIRMQNLGTKTWDNIYTSPTDQEHKLTTWNPAATPRWGVTHLLLPGGAAVPPGSFVTFSANFTAPATPGTYPFDFSMLEEAVEWFGTPCAKNGGIVVTAPTTTGTLSPAAPTCTIASGASSCNVNLTWTTTNPVGTSAITAVGMANYNGNSGTNIAFAVPYNARTFYLYNNAILLAASNATATCTAGTSWNGTICTPSGAATSCPSGDAFVASKTLGTLRNDYGGWVGAEFRIGASPRVATALGRIRVGTNTQNHTVKLVDQASGADVPGGSVSINMSSGTAGEYVYVSLGSPITLSANTSYYVVSEEVNGGDEWYRASDTQIIPTAVGTIPGVIYGFTGLWSTVAGTQNRSYVPIDLCTTSAVPQASFYLNPTTMSFAGTSGGATPAQQILQIVSSGTADVGYTATSNQSWCKVNGVASVSDAIGSSPTGQSSPVSITVADPGTMTIGTNTCLITVTDPSASPTNRILVVTYTVSSGAVTQYNLTVNKTIGGSVTSTDGLISCGATCVRAYNAGSIVTLQAVPDTVQWRFVGWGGSCSGTGNCTLTVDGNKTVTAQFRPRALLYQEF